MSLNTTILRKNVLATALLLATGAALAAPVVDAQTKDVKSIVIVDSPTATPFTRVFSGKHSATAALRRIPPPT